MSAAEGGARDVGASGGRGCTVSGRIVERCGGYCVCVESGDEWGPAKVRVWCGGCCNS